MAHSSTRTANRAQDQTGGATKTRGARTVRRQRQPEEVSLVYCGRRTSGAPVDQRIRVVVPDEDNATAVAAVQAIVPGLDEASQRAPWDADAAQRGQEPKPYVPLHERLALSGPFYRFEIGRATLVHEADAPYLLAHPLYRIERAEGGGVAEAATPPDDLRRPVASAAPRRPSANGTV